MRSRIRGLLSAGLAAVLTVGLLQVPAHAGPAEDLAAARELAVRLLGTATPSVRRAAEAALLGSDADLLAFVDSGRAVAQEADGRAAVQVLAGMDGPATRAAALDVLAHGSAADIRTFVEVGHRTPWNADERLEAANQAVTLEQLARDEDAARLAEATEQGVAAAQAAAAQEQAADAGDYSAWNRGPLWDTEEDDGVDPDTRALLNAATAPGAPGDVVRDRGRRAALALVSAGGQWSRSAARDALAGDDVQLRSWLTVGRAFAAAQDNRERVWRLVDTLPDGAEKTAAQASLDGDDAAVTAFLRTRMYPGKVTADRQQITAILNAHPGPNLTAAAQRALAGTTAEAHTFLRTGQYTARTADDRIEVTRIMNAGGPEVRAAAQVALAGPGSYVSYFLAAGRYQAAQRDEEQATHVDAVRAMVRQAQQYAQSALADAAEAQRVAAVARNAAEEARQAADRAAAAANQATQYANQAAASAAAARTSADRAAQSAQPGQS